MLPADAAAKDEQIGGEEKLQTLQDFRERLGPFFIAQLLPLASIGGCSPLSILAPDLQMAQLSIGQQLPVDEDGAPDTRPQGQHKHDAIVSPAGSKFHLGDAGGVGIVEQQHRAPGFPLEQLLAVGANPGLVHVGGAIGHAVPNDRRECAADGTLPAKMAGYLSHDIAHIFWHRWLRGRQAIPPGGQYPLFDVNHRAFDTGSSNVNAQDLHQVPPAQRTATSKSHGQYTLKARFVKGMGARER